MKDTIPAVNLAEQIGTLERTIRALLVEQERLPADFQAAAEAADADRLVALRLRADELPARIFAEQATKMRLEIAQLETQLPDAEAEHAEAHAALAAAVAAFDAARDELNRARGWAGNADVTMRGLRIDIEERTRRLQAMIDEAGHPRGLRSPAALVAV